MPERGSGSGGLGRGARPPEPGERSRSGKPRSERRRSSAGSAVGAAPAGERSREGKRSPELCSGVLRGVLRCGGQTSAREGGAGASAWISGVQNVLRLWSQN